MNKILVKILFALFLVLMTNCKDEIISNSNISSNKFYKLEGNIFLNSYPAPYVDIFFDTVKCITDTMGYFIFDSLMNQTSKLRVDYPNCYALDTLLTISKNLDLKLNLKYKSSSFFPLSIGNRWIYSLANNLPPSLVVEVLKEVDINSHMYFMLEKSELNGKVLDTLYYRFEGDKLIQLFIGYSSLNYYLETVFADFAATEVDTFKYYIKLLDGDYYYNGFLWKDMLSNIDIVAFYYHLDNVSDLDFRSYFKIGVGLTKLLYNFGQSEFLYAYYIK